MATPIKAAPTARGDTYLNGMKNILTDTLYEMGYDDTLVDTLIARNVVDFGTVNSTRDVIDDLVQYYGESVLCGGLPDAVICDTLDTSLTGELGKSWRISKGDSFRERVLHMITVPIELLGLKVVEMGELKGRKLTRQLSRVLRNVVVDYGEFGMQRPDVDLVIYDPKNSRVFAVISSKLFLREHVIDIVYWKMKLLESENTAHIKVYLLTSDIRDALTKIKYPVTAKVMAEVDLDGTYILTARNLEESDKVKLFEHFTDDLKQVIEESQ